MGGWVSASCTAAFAGLTVPVLVVDGPLPGEAALVRRLVVHPDSAARSWWEALSAGTDTGPLLAVTVVVAVVLAAVRRPDLAGRTVVGVLGVALVYPLAKALVDRERPSAVGLAADVSAGAYPSGHAAVTAAVAGAFAAAVAGAFAGAPPAHRSRAAPAFPLAVAAVGGGALLLVAAGQLALGRHYPSDLVAGWLLAGSWLGLVQAVRLPSRPARDRLRLDG